MSVFNQGSDVTKLKLISVWKLGMLKIEFALIWLIADIILFVILVDSFIVYYTKLKHQINIIWDLLVFSVAAFHRCSYKKVFWKYATA